MTDDKNRVTRFPGRRSKISMAVASVIGKDQPAIGGSQGDYLRDPCGSCLSWRRDSRAGKSGVPLTAGMCMLGPPTPVPILDDQGGMRGTMVVRPPMSSDSEGCDQHDNGSDEEEGDGEPVSLLASAG